MIYLLTVPGMRNCRDMIWCQISLWQPFMDFYFKLLDSSYFPSHEALFFHPVQVIASLVGTKSDESPLKWKCSGNLWWCPARWNPRIECLKFRPLYRAKKQFNFFFDLRWGCYSQHRLKLFLQHLSTNANQPNYWNVLYKVPE